MQRTEEENSFKGTEIGLVPEDWEVVKLGDEDYFKILGSGIEPSIGTREYLSTNSIQGWRIVKPKYLIDFKNRPSRANMQPVLNSVWFAKMISTVKVYAFTFKNKDEIQRYILSTGFCGVLCREKRVLPEYLGFVFLTQFFNSIKNSLCYGVTQKAINNEGIKSIPIPVPPLPEQRKIAKVLGTIQSAIEQQYKVIEAAKNLKKSLLKKLLSEGLGHEEFKDTEIGQIPKNWEVKRLIEIATLQRGKDLPIKERIPGFYAVIGSNGIVGYHNTYVIDGPGVTVGRSGSVGKLIYFKDSFWPLNTALYIKDFHGNDPLFVYYLLHTIDFSRYATGVSVPTLNRNLVHPALLPLPPISEQQEIAHALDTVDKKIEVEERRKASLTELFKTMLHKLMTGEIRLKDVRSKS